MGGKGVKMAYDLQKASMWKRISAFLFDVIILVTVAIGLAIGVSSVIRYDDTMHEYYSIEEKHLNNIEKEFGISFDDKEIDKEILEQATEELNKRRGEDQLLSNTFSLMINKILVIVSVSLLLAFLILEFAIPLFFGHGRTLGKKIFGIAIMQINGVRLKSISLFIRSILGKYTVETMIPVFVAITFLFGSGGIIGVIVALAILIVQVGMLIATKTNSALHDGLASTVVVDYATQMIFATEAELVEYQRQRAAKLAEERRD